jgi:hypothetical protein
MTCFWGSSTSVVLWPKFDKLLRAEFVSPDSSELFFPRFGHSTYGRAQSVSADVFADTWQT